VLLTLTTTHTPATDLGYLLHKNPARAHTLELSFGLAHVFYPEATETRCTAALLIEVDPIALSRAAPDAPADRPLEPYVNDRPYVASSFLSVALGRLFRSAMAGSCKDRPELPDTPIPLEVSLACVPCRGGEALIRALFEPLGHRVSVQAVPLDPAFPEWGDSRYFRVDLAVTTTVRALLAQLYVLIPVLDDEKHYWVGDAEVEKLLRHGEGWLSAHPARELVTKRYLRHQRSLATAALAQLYRDEEADVEAPGEQHARGEDALERGIGLDEQRRIAVMAALVASGAESVVDLGCGEGKLLRELLREPRFTRIVGVDVAHRSLERARVRLGLDDLPERQRARITLLHGSVVYRDARLAGLDAAALVEVIEHLDPSRLRTFEEVVFRHARPGTLVVTTPNIEHNVHFPALAAGRFRHDDHRFEWTRAEFAAWATRVAGEHHYDVRFAGIGRDDEITGPPTQMAVFTRRSGASS
jgi:3' terminal RNA ribose 2'-O-methyltransferase Hen1